MRKTFVHAVITLILLGFTIGFADGCGAPQTGRPGDVEINVAFYTMRVAVCARRAICQKEEIPDCNTDAFVFAEDRMCSRSELRHCLTDIALAACEQKEAPESCNLSCFDEAQISYIETEP